MDKKTNKFNPEIPGNREVRAVIADGGGLRIFIF